ncbi:MAG TPA: hypothetical protein VKU85_03430, partial [bacterium]|nr:hypothetical protein [bacterium]
MTPSLTSRVLAGTLLVALAGAPPAPAQVSTLVSGNPAVGDAIVLDDAGDIFVTSYSSQVATVDQAGTVTVLATDMSLTTGLTLHAPTSTLYVGNNGTGTIRTVPVTGGASSVFLTGVGAVGLAQNASEDTLYVAHY